MCPNLVALCQVVNHGLADHGVAAVVPLDVTVVDAEFGLPIDHKVDLTQTQLDLR